MDMGVCTNMSVILKQVEVDSKRRYRLRKLLICEKCRVCFVRKITYEQHISWCKGINSQQFVFSQESLQTFEEYIKCRDTPPITIYYDLETSSSKVEMKVISYSYVVVFRKDLHLPSIIAYRSASMTVEKLLAVNIPGEIGGRISGGRIRKNYPCAHMMF